MATKRCRIDSSDFCQDAVCLPTLIPDPDTGSVSAKSFRDAYDDYQAVYLPRILRSGDVTNGSDRDEANTLSCHDLADLFDSLDQADKDTFCTENAAANGDGGDGDVANKREDRKPSDFLRRFPGYVSRDKTPPASCNRRDDRRGYCSFLVQEPKRVSDTLDRLPLSQLPLALESKEEDGNEKITPVRMRHGPCLWIFFGRNGQNNSKGSEQEPLEGRPEHTDSVSHDGTWHYQLSGVKEWHLRPTTELIKRRSDRSDKSVLANGEASGVTGSKEGRMIVKCSEGDVLVVNTRLWWHSTVIPPQSIGIEGEGEAVPSVSYARDVYFDGNKAAGMKDGAHKDENGEDNKMSNLDGLYAADDIEANTVIFTEQDMPDCELHRSATDPNCEVVLLEDGMGAIVSVREIKSGEFFCIAESSDEEEEEGDDIEHKGKEDEEA